MNTHLNVDGRPSREARLGKLVNEYLTAGSDRISYKAQLKLAASRKKAVDLAGNGLVATRATSVTSQNSINGMALSLGSNQPNHDRFGLLLASIPALLLAVGLFGISQLNLQVEAAELATEDVLLLIDDLPPAAYADHGFGVFIKNTRVAADDFSGSP
jgi:Protein of unknown function (DUF3619)